MKRFALRVIFFKRAYVLDIHPPIRFFAAVLIKRTLNLKEYPMFRILIGLFVASITLPAFARGISCYQDARPVDGMFVEVRLSSTDRGYQLTRKTISPRQNAPEDVQERVLARNMQCKIKGVLADCQRTSASPEESSNTLVTFTQVDRLIVGDTSKPDPELVPSVIEIEVVSPQMPNQRETYKFRLSQPFGACFEI
jgi:hypothetical protein